MSRASRIAINDMEYKLILPKRDRSGNEIKKDEIAEYIDAFTDQFGGSTVYPSVIGCWTEGKSRVCEENVVITSVRDSEQIKEKTIDEQAIEDWKWLKELSAKAQLRFGQSEITYSGEQTEIEFKSGVPKSQLPKTRLGIDVLSKLL